ncbi:ATP-binding cassette domain-containing protein [Candidatus Woesearchaeota archaeon]|nr:ATP-binding cassette domain-containing protein [Candidatus Woesearchaeota archaeon]
MKDIIVAKNLSKSFKHIKAVDDISFSVKPGKIVAFLGPNGAGKTTTIKMLTTLLNPTSGTLEIDGNDPVTEKDIVRKSFGIVFQDPSVDDELTAYENMEFHGVLYGVPKKERAERIKYLLSIVDLWDRKDDFVKTFSGGMKRRLEIARGLIHHPKILFLDEPTLGLDPQTRENIWEHILELNKKEGMTIFFTTHYMPEAEKAADEIIIIDHGRIMKKGSLQKLKKSTKSRSLEEAFLKITGKTIREDHASKLDRMRLVRRIRRR